MSPRVFAKRLDRLCGECEALQNTSVPPIGDAGMHGTHRLIGKAKDQLIDALREFENAHARLEDDE